MDCIFCKIIAKKITNSDIIYEDAKVIVILDIDNVVKWHTLVIWKEHYENLSELSEEEYLYFSKIVYKTEKWLLKICKKNRWIILKSWWINSHFHFHIYPVNKEDNRRDIHDLIEKDSKYREKTFLYEYKPNEKESLIDELNKYLQNK